MNYLQKKSLFAQNILYVHIVGFVCLFFRVKEVDSEEENNLTALKLPLMLWGLDLKLRIS